MKHLRIGLLLLLGFLATGCGLTNKTILYFNNGKEVTGFGKIHGENGVRFKTKDSKAQTYNFNDLKKVKIYEGDDINTYVSMKVKGTEKYKIVKEVVLGRVCLYKKVNEGYVPGTPMGGGFGGAPMMSPGYSYSISNYYVKKEDETEMTYLGSTSLFSKNFKKAASEYFKDCPSLVAKIQKKELKKKNMVEIVEYYNDNCN